MEMQPLLPRSVEGSWFCVELTCSARVCVGSLLVLRLPATVQKKPDSQILICPYEWVLVWLFVFVSGPAINCRLVRLSSLKDIWDGLQRSPRPWVQQEPSWKTDGWNSLMWHRQLWRFCMLIFTERTEEGKQHGVPWTFQNVKVKTIWLSIRICSLWRVFDSYWNTLPRSHQSVAVLTQRCDTSKVLNAAFCSAGSWSDS